MLLAMNAKILQLKLLNVNILRLQVSGNKETGEAIRWLINPCKEIKWVINANYVIHCLYKSEQGIIKAHKYTVDGIVAYEFIEDNNVLY